VVEEAPAPGMSMEMRRAMGDAAVKAAEAIGYQGAGTVEFIVDVANGLEGAPFYFMEMNTRLQVEHPVTEMITGQDLVEWQIRVAEGQPLPLSQDEIEVMADGHAIEVRLYAEDPYNDFMPSIGTIGMFDPFKDAGPTGRIDAGVQAGDEVSIHYDPMIGKLIAWGEDRERAIDALIALIADTPVTGLATNRDFLAKTLAHEAFRQGDVHTGFIAEFEQELLARPEPGPGDYAAAAFAIIAARHGKARNNDPWSISDNFRLNLAASEHMWFDGSEGELVIVEVVEEGQTVHASVGDTDFSAKCPSLKDGILAFGQDGMRQRLFAEVDTAHVTLVSGAATLTLKRHARDGGGSEDTDGPGTITAPMPGKILDVKVADGEAVERGQPLLVMEAMKMEQTINAPRDGVVSGLALTAGNQVADGAVLLTIEDKND